MNRPGLVVLSVTLALLLLPTSARAGLTGTVIDADKKPIAAARVCYVAGNAEQMCVSTDEGGFFELPASPVDRMRVVAEGYLPVTLAAVTQQAPITLALAAAIRVRLEHRPVDGDTEAAEGEPIEGEVFLVFPSGRRVGPFPANAVGGVRVNSLEPGKYRVVGKVPGYVQHKAVAVTLEAGKEADVLVALREIPRPPASDSP